MNLRHDRNYLWRFQCRIPIAFTLVQEGNKNMSPTHSNRRRQHQTTNAEDSILPMSTNVLQWRKDNVNSTVSSSSKMIHHWKLMYVTVRGTSPYIPPLFYFCKSVRIEIIVTFGTDLINQIQTLISLSYFVYIATWTARWTLLLLHTVEKNISISLRQSGTMYYAQSWEIPHYSYDPIPQRL